MKLWLFFAQNEGWDEILANIYGKLNKMNESIMKQRAEEENIRDEINSMKQEIGES